MGDTLANTMTFIGGVGGGAVGFVILGFILLVLFMPLTHYLKSRKPEERSGLSRFSASINKPDAGYRDRIPADR